MRRFFYFLVIPIFFYSGCFSQKEIDSRPQKMLPSWYVNPPQTTSSTLYATGEGEDGKDAVSNALSMMASTLSVSVASQFTSKKIVKEGTQNSIDSIATNEVQSDVKKIRIANYEVLNSQEYGFRKHIVLIKSDKQKLFDSFKDELEQKFRLIDGKIKQNSHNAIERLNIYKAAKTDIADVPNTLTVMNVLNASFSSKEYIDKIKSIEEGYDIEISNISFSVESDEESKNLEASVKEGLSLKKLKIKNGAGETHFKINIASNIQRASSYGFTLARSAIEITVKDYKNSVVGSSKLNITGQSTQGYEIAKESVAIKLGEMIKKEGIGKILGLEL